MLSREELRGDLSTLLKAGYQRMDAAERMVKPLGYTMDRELSTFDTMVFVKRGYPVVLARGSATAQDWLVEDAKIAAGRGRSSARVQTTLEAVIQSKIKYGKPVSAIGHSLGGRLAEESQADGWIFTVDKATSPLDAFKKLSAGDRQTDIRTAADVVSASSVLQRGGRRTETIKQTDKIPRFVPYPVRAL
jgi:hypothetical protein